MVSTGPRSNNLILLLLGVLIFGGFLQLIIVFKQSITPKVQDFCSNAMEWCRSVETAKACNVRFSSVYRLLYIVEQLIQNRLVYL